MNFDNAFCQGKPDPIPICAGIQFIEQAKDAILELRIDPNAVIPDKENWIPIARRALLTNLDKGIRLIAHELGRIIDQILQNLEQARAIAIELGKIAVNMDADVPAVEPAMQ